MQNILVRNILAAIFSILLLAVLSIYYNVLQATARATVIDAVEVSSLDGTTTVKVPLPLTAKDILDVWELDTYVITLKAAMQDGAQYFYIPQLEPNVKYLAIPYLRYYKCYLADRSETPFFSRSFSKSQI
jgi:hypothetical protein